MFEKIILIFTSLMIVFLFLNLYFRIKILKIYRQLVNKQVDFPPSYILQKQKLIDEIIPKYPESEQAILLFNKLITRSLRIAFVVFVLSLLIGYQYVKNR